MNTTHIDYLAAEKRRETSLYDAEQSRLAKQARTNQQRSLNLHIGQRTLIAATLVIILLATFVIIPAANAQTVLEPGGGGLFHDYGLAFTLGQYYDSTGRYELAIEQYTTAAESLPDAVYEIEPSYATIFWALGDAQFELGLYNEALASYEHYISFTGDEADSLVIAAIKNLQIS